MDKKEKNKKTEIIPAILPKNFAELERKLSLLKDAFLILENSGKPIIQIDICDGVFVPSKTWAFAEGEQISQLADFANDFDFELDLMVENPYELLENWQKDERLNDLSRSNIRKIIIHNGETLFLNKLRGLASQFSKIPEIGLAIPTEMPLKEISLKEDEIDFVQFMGIDKIGYQGQSFNPAVIEKIKNFRAENPNMTISIDGGVNLKNAKGLIEAGVNRLVVGSAIFKYDNPQDIAKTIQKFKEI